MKIQIALPNLQKAIKQVEEAIIEDIEGPVNEVITMTCPFNETNQGAGKRLEKLLSNAGLEVNLELESLESEDNINIILSIKGYITYEPKLGVVTPGLESLLSYLKEKSVEIKRAKDEIRKGILDVYVYREMPRGVRYRREGEGDNVLCSWDFEDISYPLYVKKALEYYLLGFGLEVSFVEERDVCNLYIKMREKLKPQYPDNLSNILNENYDCKVNLLRAVESLARNIRHHMKLGNESILIHQRLYEGVFDDVIDCFVKAGFIYKDSTLCWKDLEEEPEMYEDSITVKTLCHDIVSSKKIEKIKNQIAFCLGAEGERKTGQWDYIFEVTNMYDVDMKKIAAIFEDVGFVVKYNHVIGSNQSWQITIKLAEQKLKEDGTDASLNSMARHINLLYNLNEYSQSEVRRRESSALIALAAIQSLLQSSLSEATLIDPVVTPTGNTYSREELLSYMREHGNKSPTSGQILDPVRGIIPNKFVSRLLEVIGSPSAGHVPE